MKRIIQTALALAALSLVAAPTWADDMPDGAKVFKKKCKMCHAIHKKKVGPMVASMNADPEILKATITNGKRRMPRFGHKLSEEEIDAVVAFIQENQSQAVE